MKLNLPKYFVALFLVFAISNSAFSQDKEDIIEILKLVAADYESEVFFNNDTPYGRALFLDLNPVLGNRRNSSDPAWIAFNDLTEDDFRGFDRPILINQREQEYYSQAEVDFNSSSAPKYAVIMLGRYQEGILLSLKGAAYQELGYNYHGQFKFQKTEDEWEMIGKEIEKLRF